VRAIVALSLAGVVCALVGGAIFHGVHGDTPLERSIAYGCWFAATVVLVLAAVSSQKLVWRRTSLPVLEGWVFVSSAVVLTGVGAVIDAVGT
jgi:hypothetical protein